MDRGFIQALRSDAEIEQCQGCKITYKKAKTFTEGQVFEFFFRHGMLAKKISCRSCSKTAKLCVAKIVNNYDIEHSLSYFTLFHRCNRQVANGQKKGKRCNFRQAVFSKTLCQNSRMKLREIFQITAAMLTKLPPRHKFIIQDVGTTSASKAKWCLDLREVLIVDVSENSEKLGGEGHYVEIYIAINGTVGKLYKPWSWAIGGVDQSTGHTFLIPVENLKPTTVRNTILQKINPGTTIVSESLSMPVFNVFNKIFAKHNINFVITSKFNLAREIRLRWCHVIRGNPEIHRIRPKVHIDKLAEYLFKSKYKNPTSRLHAFCVAAGKLYPPV